MGARHTGLQSEAGRMEAERLIALAIDLLDKDREQIVRDYLNHALSALDRVREDEPSAWSE